MFKLAELFVDIKAKDDALQHQMGAIKGQMSAFSVAIGSAVGGLIERTIGKASELIHGFFHESIQAAMDLGSITRKLSITFGDATKTITGQAEQMAHAWGLPLLEAQIPNAAAHGVIVVEHCPAALGCGVEG